MSRARHEAVRFDATRVRSVDWITYPIADMTEVPDAIDIEIVGNRPEAKSSGAGEPSSRPVAAAIANALFDATGVRLLASRRAPRTSTTSSLRSREAPRGSAARRAAGPRGCGWTPRGPAACRPGSGAASRAGR